MLISDLRATQQEGGDSPPSQRRNQDPEKTNSVLQVTQWCIVPKRVTYPLTASQLQTLRYLHTTPDYLPCLPRQIRKDTHTYRVM